MSCSTLHADKTKLHTIFADVIENDRGIRFNYIIAGAGIDCVSIAMAPSIFAHRLPGFDTRDALAVNQFKIKWPLLPRELKEISKAVWLGLYAKFVDLENV